MDYQLVINDLIGAWGFSKQFVQRTLAEYKGKHVDVKISSYGGDLDHGLDIRQQFIDHGDVTVYLSGFVASAATVIAMGAKKIVMSKYAHFLVHKCSNFLDVWGNYNADEMEQLIQRLTENKQENDKIDVTLAQMYAARCKKKVSEILETLKKGAWLTADEALAMGFIDEISEDLESSKFNMTDDIRIKFNAMGLPPCEEYKKDDQVEPINDDKPMKNYDFKGAAEELGMEEITPDKDGFVSVKADEFETLSKKIDEYKAKADSAEAEKAKIQNRVAELEAQVENLKKAPGDDTVDIKDDGKETEKVNSIDMYNKIKDLV